MKLFSKHVMLHCMDKDYHFDVTIMIDEKANSARFQFNSADYYDYDFPADGLTVLSDLKGSSQPFELQLSSQQLTNEMSDCVKDYILKFDFRENF